MSEKYGFVYIWFDHENRRFYVGSHWGSEDDGYVCSSTWMRNSYNRHRENFKRRVISRVYTNRFDLVVEEQRWLAMIKKEEVGTRYYNKSRIAMASSRKPFRRNQAKDARTLDSRTPPNVVRG